MKPHILLVLSLVLVVTLFGSSQVQPTASQPLAIPPANGLESLIYTFKIPALQSTPDGLTAQPALEGYETSGAPGNPLLPAKAYNIALPPDVIPESVQAQVIDAKTVELEASAPLPPAKPGVMWVEQRQVEQWGKNAASIVDGKNTLVYQNDAFFPPSQLSSVRFDQMRKWRYVTLLLTPLQYNPLAGTLRLASEVQVQVSYQRLASVDQRQLQIELSDTVMDERAAQLLLNIDQARGWYPVMAKPSDLSTTNNYVIITSKNIVTASKKLNSFVAHKQAQGYSVLVVTEDQYGTTPAPSSKADIIRDWLKSNYQALSIEYVLLIGNPTPFNPDNYFSTVGDVPMEMCWPAHRYLDEKGKPLGQNIPTDTFYANLTGNWNPNKLGQADHYCGELTDDDGADGMSFQPEVYVGRIPVYQNVPGWVETLDSILDKTIIYEDSGDLTWRNRALLPMSFSDSATDGAYLAEAMKNDYLNAAGYATHTFYQRYLWWGPGKGGTCYSNYSPSQVLGPDVLLNNWKNNDYGIVTWWAHGGIDAAQIGYGNCVQGDFMKSSDVNKLDTDALRPAIVFQASCLNGYPESVSNLGYSLLRFGAVATISSARNSIYHGGDFIPSRSNADNASLAYYVTQRVVNGETVGHALYHEKFEMSQLGNWDTNKVGNWFDFNLYGDPSLSINDGKPTLPSAPSGLAVSTLVGGLQLTWTDNSDNELGFVLERSTSSSGPWVLVANLPANQTSLNDFPLACGSHYYYRVMATNAYGSSGYSGPVDEWSGNVDDYEVDDTYSAANFITPTGSGAAGQTRNFDHPGDVDWVKFNATFGKSYTISTSALGASNDTFLDLYDYNGTSLLVSNDTCPGSAPAACIQDWVATANAPYYIKVSHRLGEGGCTGYEYNLLVKEGGVADTPAQPTGLTATPVSHCQVNLSWIAHSFNEQGFEIDRLGWKAYGANSGMWMWQKIATVGWGVTDYSDSGLECNKSYPYRVRAYNANGKSFYSNEASATTLAADAFETDNSYANAQVITTAGDLQYHNFHVAGDQDWVKFTASAGQVYTITTSSLGSANDTLLQLYDKNGVTQLDMNDDCVGLAACINSWVAPSGGVYYVRVRNFYGKGGCPGYQYSLSVTRSPNPTALKGPSGLYFSDETVSSLLLAWPDPNTTSHAFKVERWQVITGTLGQWWQLGIAGPGWGSFFAPDFPVSAGPSGGTSSFRDTGLTCNTTYSYRVRAFDDAGDSPFSEVISATTPLWDGFEPDGDYTQAHNLVVNGLNLPAQNHNLGPGLDTDWFQFTATAGEVYTITTSQFTHSDSYTPTLALYDNPPTGPLEATQRCGAGSRALCINGWSPRTSGVYNVRVSGEGGCPGHDYFLNLVDGHLSATWPAPPTVFTGTLTLPDTIDLSWSDSLTNTASGYRLERLLGTGWLQIADLGYGVLKYRDAGLACGQPYEYRLYAYNASGNSTYVPLAPISTPACVFPIPYNPLFLPAVRR